VTTDDGHRCLESLDGMKLEVLEKV
jgi:hypothetical protein